MSFLNSKRSYARKYVELVKELKDRKSKLQNDEMTIYLNSMVNNIDKDIDKGINSVYISGYDLLSRIESLFEITR